MAAGLWREEAAFLSLGRAGHAVVCGPTGDKLYLLGGRINHVLCNDVQMVSPSGRRPYVRAQAQSG